MKRVTYLIFTTVLMIVYSCQNKETGHPIAEIKNNRAPMNDTILKKQLEYGSAQFFQEAGVEMPRPEFSVDELKEASTIAGELLTRNGYTALSDNDFKNKVKEIFDRTLDMDSGTGILYLNFFDPCDRTMIRYPNNRIDYFGTYLLKKQKIITDFYYVPELIDYEKTNPGRYHEEAGLPGTYRDKDGDLISIQRWRDSENLAGKRYNNMLTIINRNKFLFYNNKGSLAWLQAHDPLFLESLVKVFGYTKDKSLLTFVLRRNYQNRNELQKILWNRKCNGNMVVNKEVFDIISEASGQEQSAYLKAISDYLEKEAGQDDGPLNTGPEKIKVLGLIAYYSTKACAGNGTSYDFFSIFGSRDGGTVYDEEFRKNKYYNIADFRQIWEEAKHGGTSYPGME